MIDIQDHHIIEGDRLVRQTISQLGILFVLIVVIVRCIGETQIFSKAGVVVPTVVDGTRITHDRLRGWLASGGRLELEGHAVQILASRYMPFLVAYALRSAVLTIR